MGFSEPHPIRRHPMLPVSGPTVRAIIIATAVIFVIQYLLAAFKVVYLPAYLGVKADHVFGRLWVWQIYSRPPSFITRCISPRAFGLFLKWGKQE